MNDLQTTTPSYPAMFALLTADENGSLWAHLTSGGTSRPRCIRGCPSRGRKPAGCSTTCSRRGRRPGRLGGNRRPDSDRVGREVTAGATEQQDVHRRAWFARIFHAGRGAGHVDRRCRLLCGFAGPVNPHRQGRNPAGDIGSPTTPLRKADACGTSTRPPQARYGLSGQARTYVTEISLPPSDSGIQRLHARMSYRFPLTLIAQIFDTCEMPVLRTRTDMKKRRGSGCQPWSG